MKESYYFPHDYHARHDIKLELLTSELKMEGVGIYWCLIEMLYEEKGYIPISYYERITNVLRTEYDKLKRVIEGFDLFKNDGVKFWSESVIRRINKIKDKSEKAKASILTRWGNTNVIRTKYDGNTVKEKKGKEKKGKEKKGKEKKERKLTTFRIPTLDEIETYIKEYNLKNVTAKTFFDYFTVGNWFDSKGNPVRNWKQKLLTWEGKNYGQTGRSKQSAAQEERKPGKYANIKCQVIDNDIDDPGTTG